MKVVLNVPAALQHQRAENILDMYWLPRGSTPSGPLGATLTVEAAAEKQANKAGFTSGSYQYG